MGRVVKRAGEELMSFGLVFIVVWLGIGIEDPMMRGHWDACPQWFYIQLHAGCWILQSSSYIETGQVLHKSQLLSQNLSQNRHRRGIVLKFLISVITIHATSVPIGKIRNYAQSWGKQQCLH